jgi:hypothetical protein
MNNFSHQRLRVILLASLVLVTLAACTPKYLSPGTITSNDLWPQINTANTWTVATTQRAGAVITVELQYWSTAPITSIQVLQAIARTQSGTTTRDTTVFSTRPYQAAYSKEKQCDTLLLTYTVPDLTRSTGQTITINPIARVSTANAFRSRSFLTGAGFTWNP